MADDPPGLEFTQFRSSSTYIFGEELGRGGMGIVYLAEKNADGVVDQVVLKTLRSLSPEQEQRLRAEANIATSLRHENIVKTYGLESIPHSHLPEAFRKELETLHPKKETDEEQDARAKRRIERLRKAGQYRSTAALKARRQLSEQAKGGGDDRKLYCMVMDFVEGSDLASLLDDHLSRSLLLPVPLGAFIVARICRALDYAHQRIVHRDISPENVLLNQQGVAKLSDFGIAVPAAERIQQFAGKPEYMSPEQTALSTDLDGRSDLYSLGLVAYQMATGISPLKPPRGLDVQGMLAYIRKKQAAGILPAHEARSDIPERYGKMLERMLSFKREDRYDTAGACGNDIERNFIYAQGFGPTNNSLQAYFEIFASSFKEITKAQGGQLSFLRGTDNKLHLKRPMGLSKYSDAALLMIKDMTGSKLYTVMAKLQKKKRAQDG